MKIDKYKKKTFSKYWNNFGKNSKKIDKFSSVLKKIKQVSHKILGFKIKLIKSVNYESEEFTSYQTDSKIINYRNSFLSKEIKSYLSNFKINSKINEIKTYITEFHKIFYECKIKDLASGYGFNEGLMLYCILKIIKPTVVIESGVMRGFTTYIIHHATIRNCKIYCYDINFDNLEFKSNKAKYFNHDINQYYPDISKEISFALWDDHTSHLDRLKFSIAQRIIYNIFDDDLSFLNFHSDGWPPIPSISMLRDIKKYIPNKKSISWISKNRKGKIWLDIIKKDVSMDNVKNHQIFPDFFTMTGYRNHSQSSFVVLKKNRKI